MAWASCKIVLYGYWQCFSAAPARWVRWRTVPILYARYNCSCPHTRLSSQPLWAGEDSRIMSSDDADVVFHHLHLHLHVCTSSWNICCSQIQVIFCLEKIRNSQHGFTKEQLVLVQPCSLLWWHHQLGRWWESGGCHLPWLQKGFWYCFLWHLDNEAEKMWSRWVDGEVGWDLADWPSSEDGDQWGQVQLETCD